MDSQQVELVCLSVYTKDLEHQQLPYMKINGKKHVLYQWCMGGDHLCMMRRIFLGFYGRLNHNMAFCLVPCCII